MGSGEQLQKGLKMILDRTRATEEIKSHYMDLYPPDKSGKGIICPACGNGSGGDGDGLRENPKAPRPYTLKCFKCGLYGNVIDFYMAEQGMDRNDSAQFRQAVDELAARLNIQIEEQPRRTTAAEDFADMAPSSIGQSPAAPTDDYSEYIRECRNRLQNDPDGQAYLAKRGISLETALRCAVGYDPAWIHPTVLENDKAAGRNSSWRATPRLILPASPGCYVARDTRPKEYFDSLGEDQKRKALGFSKPMIGHFEKPFGWDLAKNSDFVYVTESAIDALSIMEVGKSAVGLNSTSNVKNFLDFLEKNPTAQTFVICLDNDKPGREAAEKLRDGMQRLNISHVMGNVCNGHKDPNEALTADRDAFQLSVDGAINTRPDNVSLYIMQALYDDIEKRRKTGLISTGFPNLDEQIRGGLRPGLVLLGAGSSLGKTTFCSQMADAMAADGRDVLYFSLEQSRLELVSKSISRETYRISTRNGHGADDAVIGALIEDGFQAEIIEQATREYIQKVGDRLSIIECGFNTDSAFICNYVRTYWERTGKRPVVFIDYLQILQPGTKSDGRRQEKREAVEQCLTDLVLLKRELSLTIFAIVSLNRSNYLKAFDFESIKETGLSEYSADVVWGLELQVIDDSTFDEDGKKTNEKRRKLRDAKNAIPRKIKLQSLKHRGNRAIYECYFDYDPRYDMFIPSVGPHVQQKAGRTLNQAGPSKR